ncbi:Protein-tyrosine phosphatase domain containing protein [Aphelenchoides fujianensis]|nr:Protein-tyrosine phosphatase domain containing protein [Aphelenchoides fujianensis]
MIAKNEVVGEVLNEQPGQTPTEEPSDQAGGSDEPAAASPIALNDIRLEEGADGVERVAADEANDAIRTAERKKSKEVEGAATKAQVEDKPNPMPKASIQSLRFTAEQVVTAAYADDLNKLEAKKQVLRWIQRTLTFGVHELCAEFRRLQLHYFAQLEVQPCSAKLAEMGVVLWELGRNRYKDVLCQAPYRVRIRWPGRTDDYVHANYIDTHDHPKRFVCTQGPMERTQLDFWQMVVQEQVENILMLCQCTEKGADKCEEYWPYEPAERKAFGDVEVTNRAVRPLSLDEPSVRVSHLLVRWRSPTDGERHEREVRHFQYVDWPDRGVPPCRLTPLLLLANARTSAKPIVVHCSAGIGRSGTLAAIDFVVERLKAGLSCVEMGELLFELRKMRAYAVQTDYQYLFLHRFLLYYFFEVHPFEEPLGDDLRQKYREFVREYDLITA